MLKNYAVLLNSFTVRKRLIKQFKIKCNEIMYQCGNWEETTVCQSESFLMLLVHRFCLDNKHIYGYKKHIYHARRWRIFIEIYISHVVFLPTFFVLFVL